METDAPLETGYGPAVPRGDNLLNDFVQGEASAFAELARARGERVHEDPDFGLLLADGGSPTALMRFTLWAGHRGHPI